MTSKEVELTDSQRMLIHMLTENTGRHMLDSGGTYGRHWESNQGRDFISEPEVSLTFSWDFPDVTLNLFHWLDSRLDYDSELDSLFHRFSDFYYQRDKYAFNWLNCVSEFITLLDDNPRYEVEYGFYGDGSEPITINTYNGEDLLSQTIQYTMIDLTIELPNRYDSGTIYFLQIHGGCDVRGGYTYPRVFRENGVSEYSLTDNTRASIFCSNGHNWDTDDAYNWYFDGTCGIGFNHLQLNNMEFKQKEDINLLDLIQCWYFNRTILESQKEYTILINSDGSADCPICGSKLMATGF
jgi:hypothetical protein